MSLINLSESSELSDWSYYAEGCFDGAKEEFLCFNLADNQYGIEILKVIGLLSWEQISSLLCTEGINETIEDYYLGDISMESHIKVPVVDLRKRFQLPTCLYGRLTGGIVIKGRVDEENCLMTLIVDRISNIYRVSGSQQLVDSSSEIVETKYLKKQINAKGMIIEILNTDLLFQDDE